MSYRGFYKGGTEIFTWYKSEEAWTNASSPKHRCRAYRERDENLFLK